MIEPTAGVRELAQAYGLTERQLDLLCRHLELVIEANRTTNLTRIATPEEGMLLHIEDSLAGLPEVQAAPAGMLGDMGCGAGFPGVPLCVATGRKTMLVDSVAKKVALVSGFIDELGLEEVAGTFAGRLEDLAKQRRSSFAVLTARALAQTGSLMELAAPLLVMGGRLVCYKAQPTDEELNHARELEPVLGLKLVGDRSLLLSDGATRRRILTFEKVAKPTIPLPRRAGMAQKKPL